MTPSFSSERAALTESEGGKVVSTRSAASTSRMRAVRGSIAPEVVREGCHARELADLPGHLDSGRAGADDDEGEPGGAPLRIGLPFGGLEGAEKAVAHGQRALQRLHLGRRARAIRRGRSTSSASRRRRSACRRGSSAAPGHAGDRASCSSRASRSKSSTSAMHDVDIAVALEDRAQRIGDLAGDSAPVATW